MRSLAGVLTALLGIASLPAVLYSFLTMLPLMADVFVYTHVDRFAPATFEVEWVRYDDETPPQAVGNVGGRREVLFIGDLIPHSPRDLNDLQDMMKGRERIDAYYDPTGSRTSYEGRHLRLVSAPPDGDLRTQIRGRMTRALLKGYLPAIVLTLLGVLAARWGRSGLGCWVYPSVFFLCCQPFFIGVILIFEYLT
jgi:hypothetical protein